MTVLRRVAPLPLLLLLLGILFATFSLTASDTAQAQQTGPTPQEVPLTWALIPDGLSPGDQFRLLFVTSGTTRPTSGDVNVYNTFVQNAANGNSVDATIRGMSGEFRAVVSTSAVHARDNTATHPNAEIPIYWLDGAKVADNYTDFYDDSWDSLEGETQTGTDRRVLVWTGSNANGTKAGNLNALGGANPRYGSLVSGSLGPIHHTNAPNNNPSRSLYALSPVLTVAEPPLVAPLSYEVPNNWPLKPSGLGANDEFRLLFLTAASTAATSASIYHYNNFVQGTNVLDHENPDPTIRALRGEFRALVSTEAVDARDNTSTTGTGVAIYWLTSDGSGDKVADDYADFYDGDWDSVNARNEGGGSNTANASHIWTGSDTDGTEYFDGTNSLAMGASGGRTPRNGCLTSSPAAPLSCDDHRIQVPGVGTEDLTRTHSLQIYALSPVFKVVDQGAPVGQTVPGDWPLIPSDQSSAGDQFRLLFVTSGAARRRTSANIADYNLFVQTHAGSGHEAIRPYRNEFRALASTAAVDANDNAAITYTASDKGVPSTC